MIIIKILTFLVLVVLTKANKIGNYYADHNNTLVRNVDYITAVRRQNAGNIWLYNFQIEYFKEAYLSRINTITTVKEALMEELIRTDGRFYPLTILSDFSKECVDKYKSLIPSLVSAKSEMERCIAAGTNQVANILSAVSSANRTLETYYRTNFEKEIANCGRRFKNSASVNYTTCLVNAVSISNAYTLTNQKIFSSQMETAKTSASYYTKTAQECSFAVQNSTISKISQASTLIDRCLSGMDDCSSCKGYFCESIYHLPASDIDLKNSTMANPFYEREEAGNCLMLNVM